MKQNKQKITASYLGFKAVSSCPKIRIIIRNVVVAVRQTVQPSFIKDYNFWPLKQTLSTFCTFCTQSSFVFNN
jgi:hypothetical protein